MAEPLFLLCVLAMTGLMVKAFTVDRGRLGYTACAALASAAAFDVRPCGLFLFAAMLLAIALVSLKDRRHMMIAFAISVGLFVLVTLPEFYARHMAFGLPMDYGANSKHFVRHYEHVWADNIAAPSFWQYLTTRDLGDYYRKFVSEGFLVVIHYIRAGLLRK